MKNIVLLIFSLTLYLPARTVPPKKQLTGKVIKISDGDTISILDSLNNTQRIRLYGIDCPEKGQDYYQVSKDFLGELCFQKIVKAEIIHIDQYKRPVAKVYIDSLELNYLLLKEGLAWQYTQFDKSIIYKKAQDEARLQMKNIWSLPNPIAPWEFRKAKGNNPFKKKSA